jgi:uncharacterized protein (UPF0147 family)
MIDVNPAIEALELIAEDQLTTKRLREKVTEIIAILKENDDIKIDRAIRELEELESMEIPSYSRTQLWDVVSMLESVH